MVFSSSGERELAVCGRMMVDWITSEVGPRPVLSINQVEKAFRSALILGDQWENPIKKWKERARAVVRRRVSEYGVVLSDSDAEETLGILWPRL